MKSLKTAKWLSLILGILLVVSGVLYFLNPLQGVALITKVFAASIILAGILKIVRYFSASYFNTSGFLLSGIFDVLLGVFMFLNLTVAAVSISLLVALWVFVGGINELILSFDLRRHKLPNWWVGLLGGALSIFFGVLLLTKPELSTFYVGMLVAFHIFSMAIGFISMFFVLRRLENYRKF